MGYLIARFGCSQPTLFDGTTALGELVGLRGKDTQRGSRATLSWHVGLAMVGLVMRSEKANELKAF